MSLYYLSYDLRENKDYDKIINELERWGAKRILKSQWCFKKINTSATEIREHFKKYIDKDDGLSIAEVSDWATRKTENSPNDL